MKTFIFLALLLIASASYSDAAGDSPRTVVLDINQTGREAGNQQEGGVLVGRIMERLLDAGYTVLLSETFVQAETAYFKRLSEDQRSPMPQKLASEVQQALTRSIKDGQLQWADLAAIRAREGGQFDQQRNWPWSRAWPEKRVLLASAATRGIPTLRLTVTWVGHGGYRPSTAPATVSLTVWDMAARLTLSEDDKILLQKNYATAPSVTTYKSWADTPFPDKLHTILRDIEKSFPGPIAPK